MLAQAGGNDAFDPLSLLGQIGIGAVFSASWFYLWRDERKQRIAAEERERAGYREMGPVLVRAVEVLDVVAGAVEMTTAKRRADIDTEQRRAELLVGELGDLLRDLRPQAPE